MRRVADISVANSCLDLQFAEIDDALWCMKNRLHWVLAVQAELDEVTIRVGDYRLATLSLPVEARSISSSTDQSRPAALVRA